MLKENLHRHPLDVVTACRAADLRVLGLTFKALKKQVPMRRLRLITARSNFAKCRQMLGEETELIDEDALIPGMTLEEVSRLRLPGFPEGAGWYFQQLLKLQFCYVRPEEEHYLIWDADTVPLRPLEFFDENGAMLLTVADEEHPPYFENYRRLLGEEPRRECSFISQHMVVRKAIVREMLEKIEARHVGNENWAWKIMRNLEGTHVNLLSEYELVGHYTKNHYPAEIHYRRLPWLREGTQTVGGIPSATQLEVLGREYAFAAFEAKYRPLRRWVRRIRSWLRPFNSA